MKLITSLVIIAALVVGVVGAVTAYLPPLSLPDAQLVGLHLNSSAGAYTVDGKITPIANKDEVLTAERLAALREAGVRRVRVKEFSFARWPEWWMFVLGCVGLGAGALTLRKLGRGELERSSQQQAADGGETLLRAAHAEVEELRGRLRSMPSDDARLKAILDTLGRTQQTSIAAFVAARPVLIAQLGMSGFARLMDAFAAAERAVNRAWSAAADGVPNEALACVDRAAELLAFAATRCRKEA